MNLKVVGGFQSLQHSGRVAMFALATCILGFAATRVSAEEKRYAGRTAAEWEQAIGRLDPQAAHLPEVIEGLILLMQDADLPERLRSRAALTLARIGKPAQAAVPALAELLQSSGADDLGTKIWSARALTLFGSDARSATPALIAMARDEELKPIFRAMPLVAMGKIGAAHPDAIAFLVAQLEHALDADATVDPALLGALIDAIALAGPEADIAIPLLMRCLRDPSHSDDIRRRAILAIGAMKQAAEVALRPLLESVEFDRSESVRDAAASSLANIGPAALEILLRYLQHPEAGVRLRILHSISLVRPRAVSAKEEVAGLLRDTDFAIRLAACETLYEIRAERSTFAGELIELLANDDRELRMAAMRLLLRIGPPTPTDVTRLRELAADPRRQVQRTAELTLQKLSEAYPREED